MRLFKDRYGITRKGKFVLAALEAKLSYEQAKVLWENTFEDGFDETGGLRTVFNKERDGSTDEQHQN